MFRQISVMKIRKIITSALALFTVFSVASCGNNTEETTTTAATTTIAETTTVTEPVVEEANTPVAYHGEMIADGNRIIGSKTNEVVRVTGMSFFWSNWSQKYYKPEYVDLMMDDFGCEVVRCSYGIQDDGVSLRQEL